MINYNYGVVLIPEIPERAKEWRNNYDIYKWCRQLEPLRDWEHDLWKDRIKCEDIRMYGIASANGAKPFSVDKYEEIGVCGFTDIHHVHRRAEFSLYVNPNKQGLGFGTKALRTLLHHGFETLNFNCIWGEVFSGNPALEIDKKLGFTIEGTLRQRYYKEGKYIDTTIISILKEEWDLLKTSALVGIPRV